MEKKNNLALWIFLTVILIAVLSVFAYIKHEKRIKEEVQNKLVITELEKLKEEKTQFWKNFDNILTVKIYNTGGLLTGKTHLKIKNNSNYSFNKLTYHIVFYGINQNIKETTNEKIIDLKPWEERTIQLKHVNYSSVEYQCIRVVCDKIQVDWKNDNY